jgi:uncharacterized protein (DUF58 family)
MPWLEVTESVPLDLREGELTTEVISLAGHEERHLTYTLRCRRRGYYRLGPLRVEAGDVLGIEQVVMSADEPRPMIVYPRVVPLQRLGLPTRSALVTLPSRLPLFEDPTRIMGVRDYRGGDSPRRIHWTATARAGRLLVKQYQPAIARETLICLDVALRHYEPKGRHEAIELAVVAAASLASHMIEREHLPVGLAADALDPLDDMRRRITLPPGAERGHLMSLLEVLARVQTIPDGDFGDLLRRESLNLSWGSTLIAVTGSIEDELSETLLFLKRGGHAVAVILVEQEEGALLSHGGRASHLPSDEGIAGVPVHRVRTVRDLAVVS